ncbi:MAG: PepSY-like domain-containing protein [Methylobacter sp.]
MKNQYMTVTILGMALTIVGQANAAEKELSKHQVPKAVIQAFEKAYPDVKAKEYEKEKYEGTPAYEVEYEKNGIEYAAVFSPDGALLQKEEEIDGKALPEAAAQAIKKAHPNAEIKEVEKLMRPDDSLVGYEVEIKSAGKEIELHLDTDGNIFSTEKE